MYDMTNNDEKLNFENVLKTLENKAKYYQVGLEVDVLLTLYVRQL